MKPEDIKKFWRLGYEDPVFFLKFYLEDWFPKDIPWVHLGILAIQTKKTDFLLKYCTPKMLDKIVRHFSSVEDPDKPDERKFIFHPVLDEEGRVERIDMILGKYTLVMMPRGFSKTTLTNGANLWKIAYKEYDFLCYVSETQTHAETQLSNIRYQIENNERFKAVFGELRPEQRSGLKWTQDILQTTSGLIVAARGRGGQVRGLNVNAKRPDHIVVDDVEDKESVATQDQRLKTRTWAYGDLMPALPRMKESATMIALGTLLHTEALLTVWETDPDWTAVKFSALDPDGDPLWEDNMSLDRVELTKAAYARVGQLNTFYLEFMNQIRNEEEAKFRGPFIYIPHVEKDLQKALVVDPAISEKKRADFCAFGVVGMEDGGRFHVLDHHMEKGMSPRQQVDKYFDLHFRWDPQKAGVEAIAYQVALVHLLREEMFRKKRYFEIEKIGHGAQNKILRVEGILSPRYANGFVVHRKPFPLYESQLLDWPNGKLDGPDVVAMCVALLDPYAAMAADPSKDLGEDEYDPQPDEMYQDCP